MPNCLDWFNYIDRDLDTKPISKIGPNYCIYVGRLALVGSLIEKAFCTPDICIISFANMWVTYNMRSTCEEIMHTRCMR